MAPSIHIEPQGACQFVVRLEDGEEVGEAWFNLTPEILEQLHVADGEHEQFVRRTAEFLLEHQSVADFPDIVELEDVLATYDDYAGFMAAHTDP
jgi:hypothetical protein